MRLYHFLEARWALDDIEQRHLRISRLDCLNDPFEFLAVDLSDRDFRNAMLQTKKQMAKWQGIICFCDNWKSPLMWAHYGDRYRGICLGFDIQATDDELVAMDYVQHRMKPPAKHRSVAAPEWLEFFKRMTAIKFEQWRYEGEHRLHIRLAEPDPETRLYFFGFCDTLILKEVILGAQCDKTRAEVDTALGSLASSVTTFKSRPSFQHFEIVRNQDESMWR